MRTMRLVHGSGNAAVTIEYADGAMVETWHVPAAEGVRVGAWMDGEFGPADEEEFGPDEEEEPATYKARAYMLMGRSNPKIDSVDDLRRVMPDLRLSFNGDHVESNTARASWAAAAVVAFADLTGPGEPLETVIGDLLGDLRHLCDAIGVDWEVAERRAMRYYRDEIGGVL